ncbi:unnamed protein product [marine sediment metagenome]|uniref:Uncharacterized protein n=1 Tax=marine sediment metagenome TaxID=412755 RepID=X1N1Q8_9ZZZZ
MLENDNLRKEMGEKSREMVKQYDWKIITKKYIEVYNQALKRRGSEKRNQRKI